MARADHIDVVKSGVKAIADWHEQHPLDGLDLRGSDLREFDLHEANLARAALDGARLARVNLARADLQGASLCDAGLRGANLTGANLSRAALERADLLAANCKQAILRHADLRQAVLARDSLAGADLTLARLGGADLAGADLSSARLDRTDLRGADLSGTNLARAHLDRAELEGARLSAATAAETVFRFLDLRADLVLGLDEVHHAAPSLVDLFTLRLSEGGIPDVFLRGCGLADWEIAASTFYKPNLTESDRTDIAYEIVNLQHGPAIQLYSVFISYSRADSDLADSIYGALQQRGVRCWLDKHEIRPGDKIFSRIDEGIRLWDKILLLCSRSSLSSWWVDKEIGMAFQKEQRLWAERGEEVLALIPLDIDGTLLAKDPVSGAYTWTHPRSAEIRERFAPDLSGCPSNRRKFRMAVESLIDALKLSETRPPQSLL